MVLVCVRAQNNDTSKRPYSRPYHFYWNTCYSQHSYERCNEEYSWSDPHRSLTKINSLLVTRHRAQVTIEICQLFRPKTIYLWTNVIMFFFHFAFDTNTVCIWRKYLCAISEQAAANSWLMEHTISLVGIHLYVSFEYCSEWGSNATSLHVQLVWPALMAAHARLSVCKGVNAVALFGISSHLVGAYHIYFRSSIVSFHCGRSVITDILKNVQRIPQTIGLNAHVEQNI